MDQLKSYVEKNFEQVFVLVVLVATALINYFIPQKVSFLNFYFLPIILMGYYLGRRRAMLGAFLCVLLVTGYVLLFPEAFHMGNTLMDTYLHMASWGGFLILSGAVVGRLQEKLSGEIETSLNLNRDLERKREELDTANVSLKEYSDDLELKVKERTEALETSKRSIETSKGKVEDALYSTMDASVVNLIIEGRLRNEKREVSVMFSDLTSFTTYSEEHPSEVVIRDLNRYLAEMEPILMQYRGHIDRYMGDGIMVEFGAPIDFETYRLLAVLAGMKMQEKMAASDFPWNMRIGIGSGSTITGLIGHRRQTYTAIGDVVNLASRLETMCPPGKVTIDKHTYEGVKRFIDTKRIRDLKTRGVVDEEMERRMDSLCEQVTAEPGNPELHFQIGKLHMELGDPEEAVSSLERALKLNPDSMECKVAYAEAGMKVKASRDISVKGKKARVAVYEVVGLKDPLDNREKFPQHVYDEFGSVTELIQIPEDVILPVEALDGSIRHSRSVAVISYALASRFNLTVKEETDILHAGFMADIGKEIISYHLLNRKGGLTADEFESVQMHPAESGRILRNLGYHNDAMIQYVLSSHEHIEGTGYPRGLKGDEIPLGSRIVAVADAYDALTSWRPYREPLELHASLDEIRRGVERGFYDPKVVDTLVELMG